MTLPPQRFILFPYTTLFRSELAAKRDGTMLGLKLKLIQDLGAYHQLLNQLQLQDRKSTRLNSSHANISYAVFCLNKKHSSIPAASFPWFIFRKSSSLGVLDS